MSANSDKAALFYENVSILLVKRLTEDPSLVELQKRARAIQEELENIKYEIQQIKNFMRRIEETEHLTLTKQAPEGLRKPYE